MEFKVVRKNMKKPPVPFLGILTQDLIEQGAARFQEEVNSKAVRVQATNVKANSHNHSF